MSTAILSAAEVDEANIIKWNAELKKKADQGRRSVQNGHFSDGLPVLQCAANLCKAVRRLDVNKLDPSIHYQTMLYYGACLIGAHQKLPKSLENGDNSNLTHARISLENAIQICVSQEQTELWETRRSDAEKEMAEFFFETREIDKAFKLLSVARDGFKKYPGKYNSSISKIDKRYKHFSDFVSGNNGTQNSSAGNSQGERRSPTAKRHRIGNEREAKENNGQSSPRAIGQNTQSFSISALLDSEEEARSPKLQMVELPKPVVYAGIESGASQSQLIFVNEDGTRSAVIPGPGTKMCLEGIENVAKLIITWIRKEAAVHNMKLPLKGLGLGLSGAEDEADNEKLIKYLETFHGDVAEHFAVTADSYCTIQATFEQGVVFIAGTDSEVRLQLADGSRFRVGGWGHLIGDGASAYWIAQRAIQLLFDHDDGVQLACGDVSTLRKTFLEHFSIDRKEEILSHLYVNFQKHHIAKLTKDLAYHADDPVIARVFYDAGAILGKQFVAIACHMPQEMLESCDVVIIGSVFNSWHLLEQGFYDTVKSSPVKKVGLCKPAHPTAFGATVLGAKVSGHKLDLANPPIPFAELEFK